MDRQDNIFLVRVSAYTIYRIRRTVGSDEADAVYVIYLAVEKLTSGWK